MKSKYSSKKYPSLSHYAVANVALPSLIDSDFISACLSKENEFYGAELRQLHQWQLWQEELKSDVRFPPSLRDKCREAFISALPRSSNFQTDVIFELSSIGLRPEEEFIANTGYRLDALVEVNGTKVGIEVDGPVHFVGRKATGKTILKRRQVVTALDKISVVSVPHWEWDDVGMNSRGKRQEYLRNLLCFG
jgi:hypothetical protein